LAALGAALLLFAVGSAQAKPGSLDLNFGTRGSVTTAIGSDPHSDDVATGVALQANGKIVVAGYTGVYPRLEIALARYNRAGSLDTSFGGDGQVTTAIGSSSGASGVAILANGKIVVGGDTGLHPSSFAVTRYNGDGSPDTSFGVDGQVTTAIGLGAGASDLVLQPDGKIVLAGSAGEGSTRDFALARYNADGSLDSSFGTDGTITTPIGSGNDIATALARQPNGKLVAAGFSDNGSNWDFALARYNADGSLDTTFDGDGKVTTAIGSNEDRASALALQRDGKLVAAGWSYNGSNYDFALVRYNENGSLDTSFGAGGKVTTALGPNHDLSFALARQPDGKLVAGGFSESPADVPNTFILARYQANGSLDSSFGAAGSVRTAFGRGGGSASALAIQPDGKLVAAGWSAKGGNEDFALVRYLSGKERCLVPNVRRRTVPQAKRLLRRAYCSAGRITRAFSSNLKRGRVISQTPKAGMRRAVWAKVTLKISKGMPKQR
jgi:uncharacterized delta-60 repeat protein